MPAKKAAKKSRKPISHAMPADEVSDDSLEESVSQMQRMALDGFKAIESNLREIQQLFTDIETRVTDLSNRVNRLEGGPEVPALQGNKEGAEDLQKRLREEGKKIGQKIRDIQSESLASKKSF